MESQPINDEEITLLHRYVCEGVGDPKRLRLLYLVSERPCNVTELTEALHVSQRRHARGHLNLLRIGRSTHTRGNEYYA